MSAPFNFGDLVKVVGYHPRIFRIDGYHVDTWHYPDEVWTETVFDLVDAYTGLDFIEAEHEDLTLVVRADEADEYLAKNPAPAPFKNENSTDWSKIAKEAFSMAKQERQPTARELSAKEAEQRKAARKQKAEKIDNLLDMRNWYADQFAKTADVEYCDRVFAMDCELKKLTETD
ncbi:hypothetical protein AB1282_00525 [Gottfriedia sp. S16(2024)]|uniref:hypothetical protein n=1 Tax=Gottfriedia sp. S16(2024) TaxID=3162883 RepID=UPI003D1AF03A